MLSTSSRVADLFFYQELKTTVGASQAKKWLNSTPYGQTGQYFSRRNGSSASLGSCCSSDAEDLDSENRFQLIFRSARRSSAGCVPSNTWLEKNFFTRRWSSEETFNTAVISPTTVDFSFPTLDLDSLKDRFQDVGLIYTDAAHKILDDPA